jgi:superfamily I DNA/RNA helicase
MQQLSEELVVNMIRLHGPVKARGIVSLLDKDMQNLTRAEVNKCLYRLRARGIAQIDESYHWHLKKQVKLVRSASEISPIAVSATEKFQLTDQQQRVVSMSPSENILVRGQAGCGKTTVLAARAGQLASVLSKGTILFLTYNSALCGYVSKIFKQQGLSEEITAMTFHQWSSTIAKKLGSKSSKWINSTKREEKLRELINEALSNGIRHRLLEVSRNAPLLSWWSEEFCWLFGQGIKSLGEYLAAERIGRGRAHQMSVADRQLVWQLFEQYSKWIKFNNYCDYDNPAGKINDALGSVAIVSEELKYDHVFIDEVQDFDKSWLVEAAKFARVSLSMAGDMAQKIYRRQFSWKSVGIEIHGSRSQRLRESHRTTREIMNVAVMLLARQNVKVENLEKPVAPKRHGKKVGLIIRDTNIDAYSAGYQFIADKLKKIRSSSVVVAVPFSRQAYGVEKELAKLGVEAQTVKKHALGKSEKGVYVTTLHQLKGLEFEHVVLMGLDDENMPQRFLKYATEDEMEERETLLIHLLYMAMTRASQTLTLVGAKELCRYISKIPRQLFEEL